MTKNVMELAARNYKNTASAQENIDLNCKMHNDVKVKDYPCICVLLA